MQKRLNQNLTMALILFEYFPEGVKGLPQVRQDVSKKKVILKLYLIVKILNIILIAQHAFLIDVLKNDHQCSEK